MVATAVGFALAAALLAATQVEAADPKGKGGPPSGEPQGPPPAKVRVGVVRREQLQHRTNVVGRLRELQRAVVAAERSGRVVSVPVDQGSAVVGGKTTLAQIDDVMEKIDRQRAWAEVVRVRAGVTEAQAKLVLAERHHKHLKDLSAGGSVGRKEFQDAADEAHAARARVEWSKADLQVAEARLSLVDEHIKRLKVVAPFDGFVVRKMTEVGQWVDEGSQIVEVISRGEIDAVIDVSEWMIQSIRVSDRIDVLIEPLGLTFNGKVVSITPLAASTARTFPVKIRFADDKGGQLKAGMSALAQVPNGEPQQVLTVPRDAIHRTHAGTVVWANLDGKAMSIPVKVLFGNGDRYAVGTTRDQMPPLTPDMQVVIEGGERLMFPGQPLMITQSQVSAKP